jgi:hypothetical protein
VGLPYQASARYARDKIMTPDSPTSTAAVTRGAATRSYRVLFRDNTANRELVCGLEVLTQWLVPGRARCAQV